MAVMKKMILLFLALLGAGTLVFGQNGSLVDVAQAYADGKYQEAWKKASAISRADPDNAAAWYYGGISLFALERSGSVPEGDAAQYFQKAIALDSTNYWYRDRLATVWMLRGEKELATAEYEHILRDFPKRTDAYYQLVNLYIQDNDAPKALKMIDEIELIQGKSDPTVMTRYRILLAQKKQEEALAVLQEYSEEYASPQVLSMLGDHQMGMFSDSLALDYYNQALALDKDFAPALLGKAETYRMTRHFPEFFSTLQQLMDNAEASAPAKADYLMQVLQHSDPRFLQTWTPQLDSTWNTAVSRHPADSSVVMGAGVWYYRSGRPEQALDLFGRYAQAHPDQFGARVTWLQMLSELNRDEQVLAETEKALADFPDKVALLEFSGAALYRRKDYPGVIANCERMIALAPKDSAVCLNAYALMGDMYYQTGEKEKCFKTYKKALKINDSFAPVLNNYAWYLSKEGRTLGHACKMARKAVAQEPDNATYLDTLGWILHLQGKDEEAKPIFKHAMLYGGKESAVTLMHYARVLEKLGETDLAKVYRRQAESKSEQGEE